MKIVVILCYIVENVINGVVSELLRFFNYRESENNRLKYIPNGKFLNF
jgi:hypothetical protein